MGLFVKDCIVKWGLVFVISDVNMSIMRKKKIKIVMVFVYSSVVKYSYVNFIWEIEVNFVIVN